VTRFLEHSLGRVELDNYREWITQYMSPALVRGLRRTASASGKPAVKVGRPLHLRIHGLAISDARPAVDQIRKD